MAQGKLQRSSGGKLKRNGVGKLVRNSASSSTCCCGAEIYCATTCCDDACEGLWIQNVTRPYYFKYDDVCYYAGTAGTPGGGETVLEPGDVTEYDSCDDCLEIATVDCPADTVCSACGDDPCGTPCETPETFTVTFSGITMLSGCHPSADPCEWNNTGSGPYTISMGSWTGGTFTLNQVSSCQWELETTGPTVTGWDNTDCTSSNFSSSDIRIRLVYSGTPFFWALSIQFIGHPTVNLYIFYVDAQSTPNTDLFSCCRVTEVDNRIATATTICDATETDELVIGYGGSAVITPC